MTVALDNLSVSDPAQRANALEVIESVGERRHRPPARLDVGRGAPARRSRRLCSTGSARTETIGSVRAPSSRPRPKEER